MRKLQRSNTIRYRIQNSKLMEQKLTFLWNIGRISEYKKNYLSEEFNIQEGLRQYCLTTSWKKTLEILNRRIYLEQKLPAISICI